MDWTQFDEERWQGLNERRKRYRESVARVSNELIMLAEEIRRGNVREFSVVTEAVPTWDCYRPCTTTITFRR